MLIFFDYLCPSCWTLETRQSYEQKSQCTVCQVPHVISSNLLQLSPNGCKSQLSRRHEAECLDARRQLGITSDPPPLQVLTV